MLSSATTFACFNAFLLITVLDISHDTKGVLSAALMSSSVSVGVLVGSVIASLVVQRVPGGIVVGLLPAHGRGVAGRGVCQSNLLCVWRFCSRPYLSSRQATLWSAASRRC